VAKRLRTPTLICFSTVWAVTLAFGFRALWSYQATPGASTSAARLWPAAAPPLAPQGCTLAVFLHPKCPCSSATVSSLDHLLAQAKGNLKVYVFAVLPQDASADWSDSPLIQRARDIPGVTIVVDRNATWARQFGALTSGYAALYTNQGKLIFSGGITPGRGHEGENKGSDTITAVLNGELIEGVETPVFGCALFNPETSRGSI
jgi:hypothetical protein